MDEIADLCKKQLIIKLTPLPAHLLKLGTIEIKDLPDSPQQQCKKEEGLGCLETDLKLNLKLGPCNPDSASIPEFDIKETNSHGASLTNPAVLLGLHSELDIKPEPAEELEDAPECSAEDDDIQPEAKFVPEDELKQEPQDYDTTDDKDDNPEIVRILRYLEARRLEHTLWGVIPVDLQLPAALFSLCSTYFIVIIQFTHLYD